VESALPDLVPFLQSLALVPLTLLPIINPVGGAAIFVSTAGDDPRIVRMMARQVAVNGWIILVASMLIGTYVLDIFGISLPIVRIGGGLLVASYGWQLLHDNGTDAVQDAVAQHAIEIPDTEIMRRSFSPLTFPLTVGPGCMSASIALGAKLPTTPMLYLEGATVAALGAAITVAVVYLCYRNASKLLRRLGDVGTLVMRRLMAFILLCIGIEIMWTGWAELNHVV
jgi:multiple antibiotic resistance protein